MRTATRAVVVVVVAVVAVTVAVRGGRARCIVT
jgi:hypothetical protein